MSSEEAEARMGSKDDSETYLRYLVDRIHTTVLATIDGDGYPRTCAVDMMYEDEGGVYFLTARGKDLYRRLMDNPRISLTGVKGEDTMSSVALSLVGEAEEAGDEYLQRILDSNPYMMEIYPTEKSRSALTTFRICRGSGEWFDLSKKPIERAQFSFGGMRVTETGYAILGSCTGCGRCADVCPQSCIDTKAVPFAIVQRSCLRCGNCFEACPNGAVVQR